MDAVGLASAVLTLAEFSWKFVVRAKEIRKSTDGMSAVNVYIRESTEKLEDVSASLSKGIFETQPEEQIKWHSKICREESQKLLHLLKKMTVSKDNNVFEATWSTIWKGDDLKEIKERLSECKSGVLLNLTLLLKEDHSKFSHELRSIRQASDHAKTDMASRVIFLRDDLVQIIGSQNQEVSRIVEQLRALQSALRVPIQHLILRHLVCDDEDSRQKYIFKADSSTCRWILDGEPKQSAAASSLASDDSRESSLSQHIPHKKFRRITRKLFIDWLQNGSGVMHISGNPGAGKSTLMKFIANHQTTLRKLTAWSGSKQLVFCQFYFWSAGTPPQRTKQGLLRSLLFQSLTQQPDLIAKVFPEQLIQVTRSRGDPAVERKLYFGDSAIESAFDLLCKEGEGEHYKFCFLIDGLDEIDGGRSTHRAFATELRNWTSAHNIKLLVSSRPWQEFLDVFSKHHGPIRLHELNAFDIQTYCSQQLTEVSIKCSEVWEQDAQNTNDKLQRIVSKVTSGAQGVFLWAHFVLNDILLAIDEGSYFSDVMDDIEQYPAELDKLYDKLREPLEKRSPRVRQKANRMLLLAACCPYKLLSVAFSWLDNAGVGPTLVDPKFPTAADIQPYSQKEIASRVQHVSGQMGGLTRGLLELDGSDGRERIHNIWGESFRKETVRFCHRTARDYILSRVCQDDNEFVSSWPDFFKTDVYGRLWLAYLLYGKGNKPFVSDEEYLKPYFCRRFDPGTIFRFKAPIVELMQPLWSDRTSGWYSETGWGRFDNSRSFLRYACFCNHDVFVLDQLRAQRRAEPDDSADPGLLCTSLWTGKFNLALSMLEPQRLINLDGPVVTELASDEGPLALPEWLVALQFVVDDLIHRNPIHGISTPEKAKSLVQTVEHLLKYCAQPEVDKSVVLVLRDATIGSGHLIHIKNNTRFYFMSRLLEFCRDSHEDKVEVFRDETLRMLRRLDDDVRGFKIVLRHQDSLGNVKEVEDQRPWRLSRLLRQGKFVLWERPRRFETRAIYDTRMFRVY